MSYYSVSNFVFTVINVFNNNYNIWKIHTHKLPIMSYTSYTRLKLFSANLSKLLLLTILLNIMKYECLFVF